MLPPKHIFPMLRAVRRTRAFWRSPERCLRSLGHPNDNLTMIAGGWAPESSGGLGCLCFLCSEGTTVQFVCAAIYSWLSRLF